METYQAVLGGDVRRLEQDLPNVQHYYVFQILPTRAAWAEETARATCCARQQRTLPRPLLQPEHHVHARQSGRRRLPFPAGGWAEFARLIQPLIERDHYGKVPAASITRQSPARFVCGMPKTRSLWSLDQPVVWADTLVGEFYLDGQKDRIASWSVSGNVLTLTLKEPSTATKITTQGGCVESG